MKKEHELDLNKIAKKNPSVDLEQVRQADKLLEQLETEGLTPHSYSLLSPFDRRTLTSHSHPRLVP